MPGDVLGSDIETIYYIRSDTAFRIARSRGLWEVFGCRVVGRDAYLSSFRDAAVESRVAEATYLGVQLIATRDITGSLGRSREFSRSFLPIGSAARHQERWRQSYTRLLCGDLCPPVQVCKLGGSYYVVNGHHRVSAARYLNVKAIQAHVSEIDITEASGASQSAEGHEDPFARRSGMNAGPTTSMVS